MANSLEQIQNLLQCELMAMSCTGDVFYHMLKQDTSRYKHQCKAQEESEMVVYRCVHSEL